MWNQDIAELAMLDVKLFGVKYNLTEELCERMARIIEKAPKSIMKRDNQSILRYAYTKALTKGE